MRLRRAQSKEWRPPFGKGAFCLHYNTSVEKTNKQYERCHAHIAYSRVMLTLAKMLDLPQLSRLKYLLLL